MDQRTRERIARDDGMEHGIEEIKQGILQGEKKKTREIAIGLLGLLDVEVIANKTGLSIEAVRMLHN